MGHVLVSVNKYNPNIILYIHIAVFFLLILVHLEPINYFNTPSVGYTILCIICFLNTSHPLHMDLMTWSYKERGGVEAKTKCNPLQEKNIMIFDINCVWRNKESCLRIMLLLCISFMKSLKLCIQLGKKA